MFKLSALIQQISSISVCLVFVLLFSKNDHFGTDICMVSAFTSQSYSSFMLGGPSFSKSIVSSRTKHNTNYQRSPFVTTSYQSNTVTVKAPNFSKISVATDMASSSLVDFAPELAVVVGIVGGAVYYQRKSDSNEETIKETVNVKTADSETTSEPKNTEIKITTPKDVPNVDIAIPEVLSKIRAAEEHARKCRMKARKTLISSETNEKSELDETIGTVENVDIATPDVLKKIRAAEEEAREARIAAKGASLKIANAELESDKTKETTSKIVRSARAIAIEEEIKADMEAARKKANTDMEASKDKETDIKNENISSSEAEEIIDEVAAVDESTTAKKRIFKKRYVVASGLLVLGRRLVSIYFGKGMM